MAQLMYYIFYTLAILEKFFTGLKITASQWTMSGQDDHLSAWTNFQLTGHILQDGGTI